MTIKINVQGMTCDGCEKAVERAVNLQPGITSARASRAGGDVEIEFDPQQTAESLLRRAIREAGYQVV